MKVGDKITDKQASAYVWEIKAQGAGVVSNLYTLELLSGPKNSVCQPGFETTMHIDVIKEHYVVVGDAPEQAVGENNAPDCVCDSKLLFDEGCQCLYAAWKRRQGL